MRTGLAMTILNNGYIDGLLQIFEQAEDLEQLPTLHTLFQIFKGLVLLNEESILTFLLTDQYYPKLLATLEYEPGLPCSSCRRHRSFLSRYLF
jgi:protein phosphatase-4 regulatory subunit 3